MQRYSERSAACLAYFLWVLLEYFELFICKYLYDSHISAKIAHVGKFFAYLHTFLNVYLYILSSSSTGPLPERAAGDNYWRDPAS